MSAIDDQLADERARLKHLRSLTDEQQAELLAYLARWAGMQIDMWLFDREADSTGTRYDAWGKAVRDVKSAQF